jgi:PAS domain S-box-containing protein
VLLALAIGATAWVGYKAHSESHRLQKEAERLALRQDVMFAVEDSSTYPLAVVDHTGSIMIWNRAMERLTGYGIAEIQSRGLDCIMASAETASKHNRAMREALASSDKFGQILSSHGNIKTASGKLVPVQVMVYLYAGRDGHPFALARINPVRMVRDTAKKE